MICIKIKLKSLIPISNKAYKAEDFNGNTDIIPKSQIFDFDYGSKSNAYYISEWILQQKSLTYSKDKKYWFDKKKEKVKPYIITIVETITPETITFENSKADESLIR